MDGASREQAYERLGALRARAEQLHAADDPGGRRLVLAAMRREAERILVDAGDAADETLRSRTFLAMAAATFSLAHFSRGAEREREVESAIAGCEQAVGAVDGSSADARAEVVSETMAILAASSHVLEPGQRLRVVNALRRLGEELARAVPDVDQRVGLVSRSIAQADVALSSLLRCGGAPSAADALAVLDGIARHPGTGGLP